MDGKDILKLPMQENGAKAKTIGEYLITLSQQVWSKGERFSGKRPFGNSGWEHELYLALAEAKLVGCQIYTYDDYVECHNINVETGNMLINKAYEALFEMVK